MTTIQISDDVSKSARDFDFYRQIARLHMEGINQGFLPQLGLGFMTLLYEAIDLPSSSILLTESYNGKIVGFVSGAASIKPIYRQILFRPLRLLFALVPSLVRPRHMKRIYEILKYSRKSQDSLSASLPAFELLSIVVSPHFRGTGCADRLYQQLVAYCNQKNLEGFKIVVGDSLTPAHRFYKRMGALPAGRIVVHEGEGSVVYVHSIVSKKELNE